MSRSRKKYPGFSDNGQGNNKAKKYAKRKTRYAKIIVNFGKFKKLYEQWKIRDYNFRWYSKREFLEYCKKEFGSNYLRHFYKGFFK